MTARTDVADILTQLCGARLACGLDKDDIAEHLGIKTTTLIRWEAGRGEPSAIVVSAYAALFAGQLQLAFPAGFRMPQRATMFA